MRAFVIFVLGCFCLNGEIIQMEKLEDFPSSLGVVNEDVLIVFDIDDVIFSTEDHFAHPYGYLKFVEFTNQALSNCSSEDEKEALMHKVSLSQLLTKRNLVDEKMPLLIQSLQKTGAKVIALTNFPRGKYGSIPKTEAWRRESLLEFGVDFHDDFFGSSYELHEIAKEGYLAPAFEKGILFSYGYSKGETLAAFLKRNQFTPSKVILIEDMLHHHQSVNASLAELGIPFIGIHYTAAHKNFGVCNEELLRQQFHHLITTSTWLKDKEILEMWNKGLKVDQYDIYASQYSEALKSHNRSSIAAYFAHFDFPLERRKVLDLGCGDGSDLSIIKDRGAVIYGLDASREMVHLAKEKNPEGQVVIGTFENIPFDDAFFDVVISKWALQTAFNIDAVYTEVARVLKTGGEFIFLTCHPMRQFIEKKREGKDYFEQEIVESVFFDGQITAKEPSHTMNEYLSPLFFRYFTIDAFEEGHDLSAEKVGGDTYPSFMIIKAKKKNTV